MFDSKIQLVTAKYGIKTFEDWQQITPLQVVSVHGVGDSTLDHLRMYLAQQECTLKNDSTPSYWKKELRKIRIGAQLTGSDDSDVCPFTILVDSMEQLPYKFEHIRSDADRSNRMMAVKLRTKALGIREGRFYQPMGDYSIDGFESLAHVERKSVQDCLSTILAYGGRRERFENELETLAGLPCAAVVIEGSFVSVIKNVQQVGKTDALTLKKNVYRSLLSLQQEYRVPWYFCGNRPMAEETTFRILARYWNKSMKQRKQEDKHSDSI